MPEFGSAGTSAEPKSVLTQSGACCVQGSIGAAPGGSLELVVADITKPDSLKADLFQGVRAVICCTAVNVSPKEGDTPNRDKYKQVGSSPCWQGKA